MITGRHQPGCKSHSLPLRSSHPETKHGGEILGDKDRFWTLQQFTTVAGQPWYALQQHSDGGVERQYTGYEHEMTALCRKLRVTPQVLPPTTEEEFLSRSQGDMPSEPPGEGRLR